MNKQIHQLFVTEANKIIDSKVMKKEDFAKSIGYNSTNALNNVLDPKVKTFVKLEKLLNFCKVYGYDRDFFFNNAAYLAEKENTEDSSRTLEVNDTREIYRLTGLSNAEIIERQFAKIKQNQDFFLGMFENGTNLLKQLQNDTTLLQEYVAGCPNIATNN